MVEGSVSVDPRAGRMRFSCESKHVISHFLHALYFENSLAIQIGFFSLPLSGLPQNIVESFLS
jgi:hypothetical protein